MEAIRDRARPTSFLALYIFLSVWLTYSNKANLDELQCPTLITAVHLGMTWLGVSVLHLGLPKYNRNSRRHQPREVLHPLVFIIFTFVYSMNITTSNTALSFVTIPYHQLVRAVIPFFTFFLDNRLRNAPYRSQVLQSLIPLTLGVVIATYGDGDHSYSSLGFLITLFSALLAGLKTMMTRYLLDELRRNGDNPSLVLLRKITPIAFCQVLASAYFAEEYAKLYETITWERLAQLVLNALLAFTINIVSFRTAGFVSPLSMNIAANVKQALIVLMNPKLGGQDWNSQMHFTGVLFTLVGSAWYLGILLAEGRVESLFI